MVLTANSNGTEAANRDPSTPICDNIIPDPKLVKGCADGGFPDDGAVHLAASGGETTTAFSNKVAAGAATVGFKMVKETETLVAAGMDSAPLYSSETFPSD